MMQLTNLLLIVLDRVYVQFTLQLLISESIFLIHKPRKKKGLLIWLLSFVLLFGAGWIWTQLVTAFTGDQSIFYSVIYLGFAGMTYLWILFFFDMNPAEVFFAVAGGYAVEHMAFTVTKILLFCAESHVTLDTESVCYLICSRFLIYGLAAGVVYVLIVKKNTDRLEFKDGDQKVVALSFILLVSAVVLSQYYNRENYAGTVLTSVICPLYGFICCVLVLVLVYYVLWTKKMQWEQEMMEQLIHISENQQKSTKEAIDIINIKCHDLKHQIAGLAAMNNESERQSYVEEIKNAVSIYDAVYHTGNEAVDYVLREKTLIAGERGIKFSSMVDGNLLSFLHAADIYALLNNAIDNAFESVLKESEEKRIVSLRIHAKGRMVMIHLENWCTHSPLFVDGLPQTDKEDKRRHGFGVKSIQYVVKKYEGQLSMRAQNEKFCVDISFPRQCRL